MIKRIPLLTGIFTVGLILSGCQQAAETPAEEPTRLRPMVLQGGSVKAQINDQVISEELVNAFAAAQGVPEGPEGDEQRKDLIPRIIDMELLAQEAERQGLQNQADVASQLVIAYYTTFATAAVQNYLEANPIDESDIEAAYAQWSASLPDKEYHARHILVEDEELARTIISELDQGTSFAELAAAHSTDTSKDVGGDLGWFTLDRMTPPFAEAVGAMETGTYSSAPVKSRFGWHVIQLDETRDYETPPMEEVQGLLMGQARGEKIEQYLETLRASATIDLSPAADKE
ncbi:MAG: peptidylprolyl isomerase [Pseudomonadota bacterium]|nr:peptidylprolyl isomerase [Pseudomonadota bacterium]